MATKRPIICRRLLPLLLLALLVGPATAEDEASEVEANRRSGLEAQAAGDRDRARHFFLRALSLEPSSLDLIGDLLRLDAEHRDRQALWLHHAVLVGCDQDGRFKPPKGWPRVAREDLDEATKLVRLRVDALKVLARSVAKLRDSRDASVLRYLQGLARALAGGSPALEAVTAAAFEKAAPRCAPDPEVVREALERVLRVATMKRRPGLALEAARILRGLHQQEKQDPATPPSSTEGIAPVLRALRKARREIEASEAPELTVEELRAVVGRERAAWSDRHRSWAAPGIARSPTGKYRVETVCGLATLLVATADVEYHHQRLVRWFGEDPFGDRPGLIRICPSYADIESEGQPFWWAPGFQSGDLTGILARFTSDRGLAGLLTHELTHRFDGALHPGLPTWLLEGRAVFTEVGTIHPHSPTVDERIYNGGRIWKASTRGFGRHKNLVKVLTGTVSDYRDYYDAGYSLWLFLRRFRAFDAVQDGPLLFAPLLDKYVRSFARRPPADHAAHFAATFADGKEGRPADLEAFAKLFAKFLREGASLERPSWRLTWDRWAGEARKAAGKVATVQIYDVSTCPRTRRRCDSILHGEEQAYLAGRLLESEGRPDSALAAYEWALSVDEPRASRFAGVADLSAQEDNPTASWVQMLAAHAIEPTRYARPGAIPNGSVKHAWTAAAGVVGRLAALGMAARVGRRGEIANALRADHDALAQHLALALLGDAPSARAPANSTALVPGCPPFTSELAGELISERWSPLDSHASGNWHRPTPSELELGRRTRGKALTGTLRDAGIRRVFVRASNFHAGTYTFRTTVRFLSAYADFRVVMGHTRRDRGIVLNLRGGDLGFATGRRDNLLELKTVRASLSDIRSFDGAVSPLSRTIQLRSPRDSFTVAVHVSGPFVRVLVDEQEALAYRRPTGAPIEGTIGFGLYSGLVAFLEPETQHHRVRGASRTCACGVFDEPLRFDRSFATPVVSYVGRRVPDLPRSPGGTLLLWYTADTPKAHRSRARVKESIAKIRNAIAKDDLPVAIHVAFPSIQKGETSFPDAAALKLPPERLHVHAGAPSLREHVHDRLERYATSLEKRHSKAGARTRAIDRYLGRPVWIMIDDLGVIRAHGPDGSQRSATTLARRLSGW